MSGEKPQSQNPFKYGDELLSPDESKWRVNAVAGDMVSVYRVATGNAEWSPFKWLMDHNWRKAPTRKWEDLTAENWRERRDMGVWCRDNRYETACGPYKLIGFEPGIEHRFKIVQKNRSVNAYAFASIYNDAGEEARWDEREGE